MPLRRWREPFNDNGWAFELKYDGFRALAFVERNAVQFVSRAGHVYRQFGPVALALRAELRCRTAVLDGELVCLDDRGRADFYALMYRRGTPSFVAFDVLAVNGRDVRDESLLARKRRLQAIVPSPATAVLALQPIVGNGTGLYDAVCASDLEGIVAKRLEAAYRILEPVRGGRSRIQTTPRRLDGWELFDRSARTVGSARRSDRGRRRAPE